MIFGTTLWPYLLAAVALIVAVVLIMRASMVPAGSGDAPKPVSPAKPEEAKTKADADGSDKEKHGWFSFLHRTGDAQSESFKRNMAALRMSVARRGYQYELPWYVVIGDPGSGKSALLAARAAISPKGRVTA